MFDGHGFLRLGVKPAGGVYTETHAWRRGMMALGYAVRVYLSKTKIQKNDVAAPRPYRGAPRCGRPVNLTVHWPDASITGEIVARVVGQIPSYPQRKLKKFLVK